MRISRPQMFMQIARVVSQRATCMRLSVGAVLVKGRSIVSIGYNGVPADEPHCAGNDCPGKAQCNLTTHAEINALHHLPKGTLGSLDLYVTDSPCKECFFHLVHDGRVRRIFFEVPYRKTDHLDRYARFHVSLYRITPSGYVMDWNTKELVEVET